MRPSTRCQTNTLTVKSGQVGQEIVRNDRSLGETFRVEGLLTGRDRKDHPRQTPCDGDVGGGWSQAALQQPGLMPAQSWIARQHRHREPQQLAAQMTVSRFDDFAPVALVLPDTGIGTAGMQAAPPKQLAG